MSLPKEFNQGRRIHLGTLRFSENLGDGVIADCFEYVLRNKLSITPASVFDFAGRESATKPLAQRWRPLSILHSIPGTLATVANFAAWHLIRRKGVQRVWPTSLGPDSLILFTGGQILSDVYLNFPLKLIGLAKLCERQGASFAIYGAGVGSSWSNYSAHLLRRIVTSPAVTEVSVRDQASAARLEELAGVTAKVVADAALWASDAYGLEKGFTGPNPRVGLGVADPVELSSALPHRSLNPANVEALFVDVSRALADEGFEVNLFTNGAAEDERFLDRVASRLAELGEARVSRSRRPLRPAELAQTISSFDSVVAFRLHALIIATTLGIPVVPLSWDDKVRAFADLMGLGGVVEPIGASAAHVLAELKKRNKGKDPRPAIEDLKLAGINWLRSVVEVHPSEQVR